MSELQFPKNPTVGQEYDFAPYRYYWDGVKWKTKGIGYNPVNDLRDELEPKIANIESQIANIESQVETIPPSLPGITNGNKFFMSWGETAVRGYIISRRKNGGFVAVALTNEVAPSDSSNTGGASNIRPGKALQCSSLKLAKTRVYAKTAGVVVSSLTTDQIRSLWDYTPTSLQQTVETASTDFSWVSPNAYVIPQSATVNESVTYRVNDGSSASIVYGSTPGSSNNVQIDVSHNGIKFTPYATIDASGGVSDSVIRREFLVSTGYSSSPWYVRITNKTTALGSNFYVAGLNIFDLPKSGKYDFDSALLQIVGGVSTDRSFQMVNGANEFAAFESSSSKWFGTYHGGHSDFTERLRSDSGISIDIRAALSSYAYISESFELFSESTITTPSGVTLSYSATTRFGDGNHITTYAVNPTASGVMCNQVFTHMCTTAPNFEKVTLPKIIIKEDDGIVNMGNVQHCKQDRTFDPSSVQCWWSGVKSINNSRGGLYLSFLPNYNKQYYGPILDIPSLFNGGMFTTAKEYM